MKYLGTALILLGGAFGALYVVACFADVVIHSAAT